MECCKSNVPGLSQTSESVMNGKESRQPVHRRSTGLTIRVRGMSACWLISRRKFRCFGRREPI